MLACPMIGHADVTVSGDVQKPGQYEISSGARLLDVVRPSRPNAESYWLAAAWLHKPELEKQQRLKIGVLFDLKMVERGALLEGKGSRAALAARLSSEVSRLPVTGRKVAVLDPVGLEVSFARNYPVADGDQLIYPLRPTTIEVLGAVAEPCEVPFKPMQQARDYLEGCTTLNDADGDFIWLIQPNGEVRRIGNGGWNREDGVTAAAGSKILVPIKTSDIEPPTPDLNQQLAEFLATQPLAEMAR
nr:capsule biosynthesis GfcC family protein [Pseudomonas sp. R5(2019)]